MNKKISDILSPLGKTLGIKKRAKLYFNSVTLGKEEDKIKIVPVGKFPDHPDGGHEVTSEDVRKMADKCRETGLDILFDYGHESLWNPKASAAGWSVAEGIEAKEDGLYINFPKLTPKAKLLVDDDEFRYLSPVYKLNSSQGDAELISVALTNTPFFRTEIEHLKNSFIQLNGGSQMNREILEFFSLKENSGEDEIAEKINVIKNTFNVARIDEIPVTKTENNASETFVNSAVEAGKILPAEKEMWKAWFEKDPETAKSCLDGIKTNSALPEKIKFNTTAEGEDTVSEAANFIKSQGR